MSLARAGAVAEVESPAARGRRLSVAPMMAWTDRHFRFFLRLITRRALLYTEMIPTGAILHGDRARFLDFDPSEHPIALQLGGAEPDALARAAAIGETWGYDEINLNVGCPSDRVQQARFGACLMAEPELVAACVRAMRGSVRVPVTVKTRIGIDHHDGYDFLRRFVGHVIEAGCRVVIIHARKAWLSGLDPKANREIPPLHYERVHRLVADFPELEVIVNGGLVTLDGVLEQLDRIDGVMIGRKAYQDPHAMAAWDRAVFGPDEPAPTRAEIVARLLPYVAAQRAEGVPLHAITRHILGLFNGVPGARAWRRHLSENAHRPGAGPEVIEAAFARVAAASARRPATTSAALTA